MLIGRGDTTHKNVPRKGRSMEFLKEILGDELFAQFEATVNAHNAKPENQDKQVKLADLRTGEYVSNEKYKSLETDNGSLQAKLTESNGLIETLKKGTKTDEALQAKIGEYEGKVASLTEENEKLKSESALKVALLDAGAKPTDMDYLLYKAGQNGEIKIGEDGKLTGQDTLISGLKTSCPSQFVTQQQKKVQENILNNNQEGEAATKQDLLKKPYAERAKMFEQDPEAFNKIMNG